MCSPRSPASFSSRSARRRSARRVFVRVPLMSRRRCSSRMGIGSVISTVRMSQPLGAAPSGPVIMADRPCTATRRQRPAATGTEGQVGSRPAGVTSVRSGPAADGGGPVGSSAAGSIKVSWLSHHCTRLPVALVRHRGEHHVGGRVSLLDPGVAVAVLEAERPWSGLLACRSPSRTLSTVPLPLHTSRCRYRLGRGRV